LIKKKKKENETLFQPNKMKEERRNTTTNTNEIPLCVFEDFYREQKREDCGLMIWAPNSFPETYNKFPVRRIQHRARVSSLRCEQTSKQRDTGKLYMSVVQVSTSKKRV
jgi:hypothetical protein